MSFHELTRRAALQVPRVRRYYDNVKHIEKELADLRAEKAHLQQSIERMTAELSSVSAEKERLGLELYVLRSDYQRLVNKFDETRTAEGRAQGRIEQLGAELSDQRGRHDALVAELNEHRGQLEALESELKAARDQREVLRAELNAERGRRETLEADLAQEHGRCQSLEGDLAQERGRRETLEADLAKERVRSQSLQSELTRQYRRLGSLEADLAQERGRREVVEAQATPALASAADLEQSHARLLARLYMLSSDLSGVRKLLHGNGDASPAAIETLRVSYLDLLESALTGQLFEDPSMAPWIQGYNPEVRAIGRDWPAHAQTMIGATRMRNIRVLAERLIDDGIEGDFIEAGAWRGGACIYMRGILAAHNIYDRRVFVADSFAGLPQPRPDLYPADLNDPHHTFKELVVTLETVKENFAKYNLLDSQVVFLPGWFKDTLPEAPIEKLALLRLDGDMYESTIQTLENLYYRVSPGGFIIIDDYILKGARQAVDDFRQVYCRGEPLQEIDGAAVYWRKQAQRRTLSRPKMFNAKLISAPLAAIEYAIEPAHGQRRSVRKERHRKPAARGRSRRPDD